MDVHIRVRIASELRDKLKENAKHNHRSMNGEVISAIEMYLNTKKASEPAVGSNSDAFNQ